MVSFPFPADEHPKMARRTPRLTEMGPTGPNSLSFLMS